jgi:hypothetical protein
MFVEVIVLRSLLLSWLVWLIRPARAGDDDFDDDAPAYFLAACVGRLLADVRVGAARAFVFRSCMDGGYLGFLDGLPRALVGGVRVVTGRVGGWQCSVRTILLSRMCVAVHGIAHVSLARCWASDGVSML